jgi:hypothetical protein
MVRQPVKLSLVAALAVSLCVAFWPTTAEAAIPSGNLLANPGAETGPAATDDSHREPLSGWSQSLSDPLMTAVRYGTPGGFPAGAQGSALDGGRSFFAGGPGKSGDDANAAAVATQLLELGGDAGTIGGALVQATLSGCLGGYALQDDYAFLAVNFYDGDNVGGNQIGRLTLNGPKAAERGGETKLMPKALTGNVPPKARSAFVVLAAVRQSGTGTYYDGYADNLSVSLAPSGTAAPAPHCTGPGGGGNNGSPNGGSSKGGGTSLLARVGKTARFSHGVISVSLRCVAHDTPCRGSLAMTVPRLPAAARAVTLGKARFSIRAGKTGRIKVKLNRKARRRLRALSNKRLQKLKITVKTRIGKSTSKFGLRLRR